MAEVAGTWDPRFVEVADAFANNFVEHGEVGAAVTLIVDGAVVADIWAGHADAAKTRPWERDTLVNVFSIGKAFVAICAHLLVAEGRLDLDSPVAAYWPEFAAAGKDAITVRHLLAHRAGLPAIERPMPDGSMLEWDTMTSALAAQAPWWEPGTEHGYHVNTFGFLVGELVRRIDGRSYGRFLEEAVTGPIDADVFVGLPARDERRVAQFLWPDAPPAVRPESLSGRDLFAFCTYFNPPGVSGQGWVNRREWRAAEIPSTNGHATARGVADVYAALVRGNLLPNDVLGEAIVEHSYGVDAVLGRSSRFGLGFQLTQPERPLGPNARAFGHFGAGGSLGFCDLDAGVAFAYVMNSMGPRWQNPRNQIGRAHV